MGSDQTQHMHGTCFKHHAFMDAVQLHVQSVQVDLQLQKRFEA